MTRFLVTVACRLFLLIGAGSLLYLAVIWCYAGISVDFSWFWAAAGFLSLLISFIFRFFMLHPDYLQEHRPVLCLVWLFFAVFLAGCVLTVFLLAQVLSGMRRLPENPDPADVPEVVLVLGAQVKKTIPSLSLKMRLEEAAEYAVKYPETLFVLTGGKGSGEDVSEADCMYSYLREKLGKSEADSPAGRFFDARFLKEDQSSSTWENLLFSDRLYDLKNRKVGILSNDFHISRALMLAKRAGYTWVRGIPAPSVPLMQPHNIMREVCALAWSFFSRGIKVL